MGLGIATIAIWALMIYSGVRTWHRWSRGAPRAHYDVDRHQALTAPAVRPETM